MKKQNGITLIALVITIIVLLILAGVSISMVTGDNGIATKAQLAKTETDRANAEEEQDLQDALEYIDENKPTSSETDETVTEISFVVCGVTYKAKQGMTWEEWIKSTDYNSGGLYLKNGNSSDYICSGSNTTYIVNSKDEFMIGSKVIDATETYWEYAELVEDL